MIAKHLTDDEIQQYALDKTGCELSIAQHIQHCEACEAKVETYQLLFSGIKQQPKPAFDFDVSELVLAQLAPGKPWFSKERSFVYLLASVTILLTGTLSYIFRGYLASLFSGITTLLMYLISTTVLTVLILLGIDMYKNYQKKMNVLDFY